MSAFLDNINLNSLVFETKVCSKDKSMVDLRLQYNQKLVEYELIKEVLYDLMYGFELDMLTENECKLYKAVSRAWSESHLYLKTDNHVDNHVKIPHELSTLFYSRLEEKLDERLDLFSKHLKGNPQNRNILDDLTLKMFGLCQNVRRMQSSILEVVSHICTIVSRLFREYRHTVQPRLIRQFVLVLFEYANGLSSQASYLKNSIEYLASQPSPKLNMLKNIQSELHNTHLSLQREVNELERILKMYAGKDSEYHDLVERYFNCQNQLNLRNQLLSQHRNSVNSKSVKTNSHQRSHSADSILE